MKIEHEKIEVKWLLNKINKSKFANINDIKEDFWRGYQRALNHLEDSIKRRAKKQARENF